MHHLCMGKEERELAWQGALVCAGVGELLAEACPWQLTWATILLQAAAVEHDMGGVSADELGM